MTFTTDYIVPFVNLYKIPQSLFLFLFCFFQEESNEEEEALVNSETQKGNFLNTY